VHAARHYRRADVRRDLGAGVVLAALLIPQGMAYAELAGLPPVTGLYTTAADVLAGLVARLRAGGTDLVLAECKGPVKDRLRRYGLVPPLGEAGFPPTLGTAIDDYLRRSGVPWVDWEDRPEPGDRQDRGDPGTPGPPGA